MLLLSTAFAQAGSQAPAQPQANPLMGLLPIILILVIFYVLVIRPQQQKQREHSGMISQLRKNDEVVTQGGIHGTIVNVKENSFVLRIAENVRIEVEKHAITRRI